MRHLRPKDAAMTQEQKDHLLRHYAAGAIAWASLRGRGFDNDRDVLEGLGQAAISEADRPHG